MSPLTFIALNTLCEEFWDCCSSGIYLALAKKSLSVYVCVSVCMFFLSVCVCARLSLFFLLYLFSMEHNDVILHREHSCHSVKAARL